MKPLEYMLPQREQTHVTEDYVSSPPALVIVDEGNNVWTLGMQMYRPGENIARTPRGEFAFDVLRNGQRTGEIASRIERRAGKIRIFTVTGWKTWTGKSFF